MRMSDCATVFKKAVRYHESVVSLAADNKMLFNLIPETVYLSIKGAFSW